MLDGSRVVAVHETAHQWFYAMVGDSQARHPWLDEAFATYAEQLVDGDPAPAPALRCPVPSTSHDRVLRHADVSDYYRTPTTRARPRSSRPSRGRRGRVGRGDALLRGRERMDDCHASSPGRPAEFPAGGPRGARHRWGVAVAAPL